MHKTKISPYLLPFIFSGVDEVRPYLLQNFAMTARNSSRRRFMEWDTLLCGQNGHTDLKVFYL